MLAFACWQSAPDDPPGTGLPAWSVQLHVHGSFSEGMGSIDSHSFEAAALGVDAIWWSDHDFRITSYQHVDTFGFEGPSEAIDAGESWQNRLGRFADDRKSLQLLAPAGAGVEARFEKERVKQGTQALLLGVEGPGSEFRPNACLLTASRMIQRRPLAAGVRVRLWIQPTAITGDARPFVEIHLSEHAPREGLGLEPYFLRYFLTAEAAEPYREGSTYHVPVRAEAGRWNEVILPLTEDRAAGFPFVPAGDDALYQLVVGVEARGGATARAVFDDLRIEHERRGPEMYDVQREVLERLAREHPRVEQLQGVEVSYSSRHLNEFSVDTRLLDYDALEAELESAEGDFDEAAFRQAVVERTVRGAHERGGLVSYNHLFGISDAGSPERRSRETQLRLLVENEVFGVDLLEVGYRDRGGGSLADHLWVWDQLALAGLRVVGTGVSDSHGGPDGRWKGTPNNFLSWVYAAEPAKPALIEGLRAGRVFFGDITLWDGVVDLETTRGQRMGQELVTDRSQVDLELRLTEAAGGDELVVIDGGRRTGRHVLEPGANGIGHPRALAAGESTFVRFEVHDASGAVKVLSNPLWILRPADVTERRPVPSARLALDLLGFVSREVHGFELTGVRLEERRLFLSGRAAGGGITFDVGGSAAVAEVLWDGLRGSWQAHDGRLELQGLEGEGTLEIRVRAP